MKRILQKLTVALFVLTAHLPVYKAGGQVFKKRAKERYRVDVLVPLYLDELVKGLSATYKDKIPEKAQYGVGFYAGVTLAADSLKHSGFNVDIYVHDIASAKETTGKLISHGLDSSDLIIGAVDAHDVEVVSGLASRKNINFISTASASVGADYNNPYLTFLQPSVKAYCDLIVDDVLARFPKENITLLYRTKDARDAAAYDYISDGLAHKAHVQYMAGNTPPRKGNFSLFIDPAKTNVFIIPVQDIALADTILHRLAHDFPGVNLQVYGMPGWSTIGELRKESAFPTLSVNIPAPHTLDPLSPLGQYVKHIYKEVYAGKMPESAYYGFEIMFWYANMLRKYGVGFNDKYTDNTKANLAHFDIQPQTDKKGNTLYYENRNIYFTRYGGHPHKK